MNREAYITIYEDNLRITQGTVGKAGIKIEKAISINIGNLFNDMNSERVRAYYLRKIEKELAIADMRIDTAILGACVPGIIARTHQEVKTKNIKALDTIINTNIGEYLSTINIEDYEWRYRILGDSAEVNSDDAAKYNILFTAVPKVPLAKIIVLMDYLWIKVRVIDALPNIILRMRDYIGANNTLVIDGNSDRVRLMLLKNKEMITYVEIPYRVQENQNDFGELYSEVRGYLEYYASRNLGVNVENVIVLGQLGLKEEFKASIENLFGIKVSTGNTNISPLYTLNVGLMQRRNSYKIYK